VVKYGMSDHAIPCQPTVQLNFVIIGKDIENSFKKADLKYRDFKDLIELSKTIINVISQDYSRNTHAFNLSAEFDTKALLTDLLGLWSQRNEKK
jgi:hypothetical protein